MTPHKTHWKQIIGFVVVWWMLQIVGGCSWTPQIETEIHTSSQGIISLRTIKDGKLHADHPVNIQRATMEHVLRGAHRYRDPRLIEGLITDDDMPKRLFSQTQAGFLAPWLTKAFAQATPEEEVLFQCPSEYEGAPPIKGKMLVHDSTLFFTWQEPLSKPKVLAKQHRQPGALMDPSMPQGHMITFFPKEAIRVEDDSTKYYLKRLGENTLAIDYVVLAGLPNAEFAVPELQDEEGESTVKDTLSQDGDQPSAEIRAVEEPPEVESSTTPSEADADIRALRNQMEELQKEMNKQQEELDRLKKENP